MTAPFASTRLGARLRLLRISNAASPMADVLTGACLASRLDGEKPGAAVVAAAMLASAAVYHAGMAFNDVADRADDVKTRPDRPIPSGLVPVREAAATGAILLLTSLAVSLWAGNAPVMGVLAATVLLYDFGTRRGSFAGPLLLGLARGVNVLAGYAAAGGADAFSVQTGGGLPVEVLTIAGGYGAAIAGLSLFALAEDQPWSRARAVIAALTSIAGLFAAYAAAAAWKSASASFGAIEPRSACLFASSLFWIPLVEPASIVLGPSRPWTPDRVGQVVGAGLRAIFVFHALILLLAGAPLGAAFCGAGYAAARVLSRWIPPT